MLWRMWKEVVEICRTMKREGNSFNCDAYIRKKVIEWRPILADGRLWRSLRWWGLEERKDVEQRDTYVLRSPKKHFKRLQRFLLGLPIKIKKIIEKELLRNQ